MKKTVIPIPYQVILKKFLDQAWNGELEVGKARHILTFGMKFDRQKINRIFIEMKEFGWIEYKNYKCLKVNVCEDELICF